MGKGSFRPIDKASNKGILSTSGFRRTRTGLSRFTILTFQLPRNPPTLRFRNKAVRLYPQKNALCCLPDTNSRVNRLNLLHTQRTIPLDAALVIRLPVSTPASSLDRCWQDALRVPRLATHLRSLIKLMALAINASPATRIPTAALRGGMLRRRVSRDGVFLLSK
jgi:hypothetical protein